MGLTGAATAQVAPRLVDLPDKVELIAARLACIEPQLRTSPLRPSEARFRGSSARR